MKYEVRFKPRAVNDIQRLPSHIHNRILERIMAMSNDLKGDIKQLTNFTPEYRLRVGDYRILFEIEEKTIVVYRIRHQREAYR